MKHTDKIYEALLNRKEKVCHKLGIVEIIKEYKRKFRCSINIVNVIKYLSRHRHIRRIFQGYYYLNSVDERKRGYRFYDDKELLFIILNKLKIKWYIGLNSAWYLAGKSWQVSRVLHILNNRFSGERKILSLKVRFFKIKENLFFGLKKDKTTKGINYFYSNPAKSSLDMIYLRRSNKLTKTKQTKRYLKHYPKWVGRR